MMNNSNIFNINDVSTIDLTNDVYTSTLLTTGTLTVASSDWGININPDFQVPGDAHFQGDIAIQGDVSVQGQSLKSWMQQVEQRLAIMRPNPDLEAEFTELRELGDQYRKLETELQDKMQAWQVLKD